MKKVFLSIILCFMLVLPTFSATQNNIGVNWQKIDDYSFIDFNSINLYTNDSNKTDKNKYYIVKKSINNNTSFWQNLERKKGQKVEYFTITSIIDMKTNRGAIKFIAYYGLNNKLIDFIQLNDDELEWVEIEPNSAYEELQNYIKAKIKE